MKWPATAKQVQDCNMQTEMSLGQAATEAAAMKATIRQTDEAISNRSHEEKLRLNKRHELQAAGVTHEAVLAHASKISEILKDAYDNVAHTVFDWTKPGPAKPIWYRSHERGAAGRA